MVATGIYLERNKQFRDDEHAWPTSCCSANEISLVGNLRELVGQDHVLIGQNAAKYTKGARIGQGKALAVVRPGSFQEASKVLQACIDAGVAVIPQGANTGLTGGSVPRDEAKREFVVINMRRLNKLIPINEGNQVLAFSGAGIHDLSELCQQINRESHSVLGSIFLNPSVGGGVALGSGGTQLRKGPVYTERLLYLRVTEEGKVEVVNTLGLKAETTDNILQILDEGKPVALDPLIQLPSHDVTYPSRVCQLDDDVSRFNADIRGNEAVRSEGKVLILASIHSTFPNPTRSQTLWIGCKDFATAHAIRKICLENPEDLPSSLEYINRDGFDLIDRAGRVLCTYLRFFGITGQLQVLWDLKKSIEALPGCDRIIDKLLYFVNPLMPKCLSPRLFKCGQEHDHNLLVTIDDIGNGGYDRLIQKIEAFVAQVPPGAIEFHKCTEKEGDNAMYFRFVMGTAFRSYCSGRGLSGLSLDYAVPKNYEAIPNLPIDGICKRMRVSHFGCAVFHEELVFEKGITPLPAQKEQLKRAVEALGGALPAEHGHGVEYQAPPETQARWKATDPINVFNPGVGKSPTAPHWEREQS